MLKGKSRQKKEQDAAPQKARRPQARSNAGANPGGNGPGPVESLCWTFVLANATPAAKLLAAGEAVTGTVHPEKILVHSRAGTVGEVPDAVARDVRTHIRTRGLAGSVLSLAGPAPEIELCVPG